MATPQYVSLTHEQYKEFEEQLRHYAELETTHTSVDGFYHKSFRMTIGDIILEVHGPIVMAGEQQ